MNTLWPHQETALELIDQAMAAGHRRILLTIPTGGGKTAVACKKITDWLQEGLRVGLYTNRRLLLDQLSRVLQENGLTHGIRAAGYQDQHSLALQLSSIQTEASRSRKSARLAGVWQLHDCQRVIVDEAHLHQGKEAAKILARHHAAGAVVLGMTATPIGLAKLYDELIVDGCPSELRECGALVWAYHYGPDEPDLQQLKELRKVPEGQDLSESQQRQVMGLRPQLWGRVWEWFQKLNPDRRPTILFAPGVEESIWFAQQFSRIGVRAAHIDGQDVWLDGDFHPTSMDVRHKVLEGSKDGSIPVLTNRFVLREGIDCPWLAHCILATVMGGTQTYLQALGRVTRAYPGLQSVTIQDHGGNWWRHGSVNADREWHLHDTASSVYGVRADRLRQKEEREPFTCPQCRLVLVTGKCPGCGFEPQGKRSRAVVTTDGKLIELGGDIFTPRKVYKKPDGPKKWEQMYWRSRTEKGQRTFAQAMGLFAYENNWQWPQKDWPFMPTNVHDHYRLVAEVKMETLVPKRVTV